MTTKENEVNESLNEDYARPFCYECEYFHLDLGYEDYSEYTPGESASVGCDKNHWEFTEDDGPRTFHEKIRLAQSCRDFEMAEWAR